MLQVTTLNYILTPVVMGMTLALVSNLRVAFNIFHYVQIIIFSYTSAKADLYVWQTW